MVVVSAQARDVVPDRRVDHREEVGDQRIVSRKIALGLRTATQRLRQRALLRAMQSRELARQLRVELRDIGETRGWWLKVGAHQA